MKIKTRRLKKASFEYCTIIANNVTVSKSLTRERERVNVGGWECGLRRVKRFQELHGYAYLIYTENLLLVRHVDKYFGCWRRWGR